MKIKYLLSGILITLLVLSGCKNLSSKSESFPNNSEIEAQINQSIEIQNLDRNKVLKDIQSFKTILKNKKKLSISDQQLHDSLLRTYIQLKYRPHQGQLLIPPRTKLTVPLSSYCLDSGRAIPEENEIYSWKKQTSLYLPEILKLSTDKKFSQELLQELIWNLNHGTYWENYPQNLKNILLQIDTKAPEKLPSQIRGEVKHFIQDQIQSHIPDSAKEALDLVKGQYYGFQDFKGRLESLKSKESLAVNRLAPVEETQVLISNKSNSYSSQKVSFYNLSDEPQVLDLNQYIQVSSRGDVQPLAAYFPEEQWKDIFKELEQLLYGDLAKVGLGYTPLLGDLIDLYEASTGKDFFSDKWLTPQERFLSAISLLVGSGKTYREAEKILHGPKSYVEESYKKYRQIRNTENYKRLEKLSEEVRGKGIPDDWRVKVTRKENQGLEFIHPDHNGTRVRVMPENPKSPHSNAHSPYVVAKKNGKTVDKNGIPTETESEFHIPLDEFDFSKIWRNK